MSRQWQWLTAMVIGGRDGILALINMTILECWQLNKLNIGNMKLNILTLDIVLLRLFAHALAPWGHPPSVICGFWPCWNCDSMKLFVIGRVWIRWMTVRGLNTGQVAFDQALLVLLLLWPRLLL
jgi:hypothetical protein